MGANHINNTSIGYLSGNQGVLIPACDSGLFGELV
jgi:hypothetical protein